MRIAINALSAVTGGGVVYLRNLLENLKRVDAGQNQYIIFVRSSHQKVLVGSGYENFKIIAVNIRRTWTRFLYEQLIMPLTLARLKVDLLYSPAEVTTLLAPCKTVLGIQNFTPYYRSGRGYGLTGNLRLKVLRWLAKLSAKRSKKIIFVSLGSQRYIANALAIDSNKATTIYHGIDFEKFAVSATDKTTLALMLSDGYILCVSEIVPNKNCETLIEAYARLDSQLVAQHHLVIVGKISSKSYYKRLLDLVSQYKIEGKVVFTGEIAPDSMPLVYQKASLFVLPSRLETFGMPLIEAMAAGVPIIASNAPAIPEITGDAALLFNPNDPVQLANLMTKLLCDKGLRELLVSKGRSRARQFSWEKCARETLAVFEEILQGE